MVRQCIPTPQAQTFESLSPALAYLKSSSFPIVVKADGLAQGKGVVVEGKLKDKKYFIADKILAKHDENYMPPEVAESLKDK